MAIHMSALDLYLMLANPLSLLSKNSWFFHNWTSSFCSACDHVSYFTFFFPLLSFVFLFPPLESKRAKETDLLPCLQGTEIVLLPSLRY